MNKIHKLFERAKFEIKLENEYRDRTITQIKSEFEKEHLTTLRRAYILIESLLDEVSKKRKKADDRHFKAIKALAPLQEQAEQLNREVAALELEDFTI